MVWRAMAPVPDHFSPARQSIHRAVSMQKPVARLQKHMTGQTCCAIAQRIDATASIDLAMPDL
jgi:hypothetical protein